MSDLIYRQAAIDAANRTDYRGLTVEEVMNVTDEVVKELQKLPSVELERKTKIITNFETYFDNMGTAVIHIPYSYKCGNCGCQLQRTYDGIDINYCPECGYRLEWE